MPKYCEYRCVDATIVEHYRHLELIPVSRLQKVVTTSAELHDAAWNRGHVCASVSVSMSVPRPSRVFKSAFFNCFIVF